MRAAKAGDTTRIELAGGGSSLAEGADATEFPAPITKLCGPVRGVWYQARTSTAPR